MKKGLLLGVFLISLVLVTVAIEVTGQPIDQASVLPADVLVVEDGGNKSIYTTALDALGMNYSVWNYSIPPPKHVLGNFSAVIWTTGDKEDTLSVDEQNLLSEYLDNGGNLFLSGSAIGRDIGYSDFQQNYLMAYTYSGTYSNKVIGYSDYGLFGNLNIDLKSGRRSIIGVIGVNYDYRNSLNPPQQIFTYCSYPGHPDCGAPAGIQFDSSKYKTIYLGFGMENVERDSDILEILNRSLKWLTDKIIITSPVNKTYTTENITVSIDTITPADNVVVYLNGEYRELGNGTKFTEEFTFLQEGGHTLKITSYKGSIITDESVTFVIDLNSPYVLLNYNGPSGGPDAYYTNTKGFEAEYTDISEVNKTSIALLVDGVVVKNSTYQSDYVNITDIVDDVFYGGPKDYSGSLSQKKRGLITYNPVPELSEGQHTAELEIEDVYGHKSNYSWVFVKDVTLPVISNFTALPAIFGPKTEFVNFSFFAEDTNLYVYFSVVARINSQFPENLEGVIALFGDYTSTGGVKKVSWKPVVYKLTDFNNSMEVPKIMQDGWGDDDIFYVYGYVEVNSSTLGYGGGSPPSESTPGTEPTTTATPLPAGVEETPLPTSIPTPNPSTTPTTEPIPTDFPTPIPTTTAEPVPTSTPIPTYSPMPLPACPAGYKYDPETQRCVTTLTEIPANAMFNLTTMEFIGFDSYVVSNLYPENVSRFVIKKIADGNQVSTYFNATELKLVTSPIETSKLIATVFLADKAGNFVYENISLISDATGPIVFDVNKTEANGTMTIKAKVADPAGLKGVWLEIKKLYSDKKYSFEMVAGENVFEGKINLSEVQDGNYILSIKAVDNLENLRVRTIGPVIKSAEEKLKGSFKNESVVIPHNEKFKIDIKENANVVLDLKLRGSAEGSVSVLEFKENPVAKTISRGFGYKEIVVDENITSSLDFVEMKFFYTDTDLSAAGVSESTLKPFYYNETSGNWELMSNSTINTDENSVSFSSTHFSLYTLSGDAPAPSGDSGNSGGGGGGGGSGDSNGVYYPPKNVETPVKQNITTIATLKKPEKKIENKTEPAIEPESPLATAEKTEPPVSGLTGFLAGGASGIIGIVIVVFIIGVFVVRRKRMKKADIIIQQ